MFTNKRMGEQIVVYSCNKILLSSIEKKEILIIHKKIPMT